MKSEKLFLTAENIIADHQDLVNEGAMLFNGEMMENTPFPWKGGIAVPTEVVIPGTKITGQVLIIDLKGLVRVDEVKVMDTYGQSVLNIYSATDIFNPTLEANLDLDAYGSFQIVEVDKEVRYIILNSEKGAITGIGEVEVWGEYIEQETETIHPHFTGKKIKDVVGVNSHDYDHVPSHSDPYLANIKDINPTLNWRLYCEINKNVKDGVVNLTDPAPGGLTIQDAIDAKNRGGVVMFSPVQNTDIFTNSYPEDVPRRNNLPFFVWDKTKTWEENRELMYDPQNYGEIRDIFVNIVTQIKDAAPNTIQHIILQFLNELDKKWFKAYHYMNAFQVAAMHSMIWDGHEGRHGIGVKDICPDLKIAWLSQAYNNLGYTKMAKLWFDHFRTDKVFCADVICVNAYCTSTSGTQHAAGAYGIAPEGTFWEDRLDDYFQFSRQIGKEFSLTEFGYDSNGSSKNSVVVDGNREDFKLAKEFPTWNDWANWYDAVYWPKWKDKLLNRQSQWDLRSILITLKYCDYSFLYHIRDNGPEGSQISGTYNSCGIAFNRLDQERGQLELKPSGIAIKKMLESVGNYTPNKLDLTDGSFVLYLESPEGKVDKVIAWDKKDDSMPRIVDVFGEPDPDPIDETELRRLTNIKDYLTTKLNHIDQDLQQLKNS